MSVGERCSNGIQSLISKPTATQPEPVGDGPPELRWERAHCVLCGSASSRFVLRAGSLLYWRVGSSRIVRCSQCGHLYQDPRPSPDTIAACYTDSYGPHAQSDGPPAEPPTAAAATHEEPRSAKQPWYLSQLMRRIPGPRALYYWLSDRYAAPAPRPPQRKASALEFGCGSGRYLDQLQAAGWQVQGIEPADEPARRCRERGLSVITGSIESAVLPPAAYDLIVAWMVLEHLHDPAAVLRQIDRLLKPGGTLLFSVPNIACWEMPVFRSYHYILNEPTHLNHFSPAGIRRLLAQNGFQVSELHFQHNLYNVIGSLGIWLQARFPQRPFGARLLTFCDHPTMWGRLALAPIAKLLAVLRQGGRMTIVAKRTADRQAGAAADLKLLT